jgi:hypothetical protein
MEDKVAYETNNRMLAELDRSQDQWVQSDFDEVGYESGGDLDRQEEIYPPLEVVTPLARNTTADTETLDCQEGSLSFSEEKDETCIASYYPMVGIFKTEEMLKRAYEKTRRPGENIKIESQTFSTPERAVGTIQGRHPDFVQGRMNDFKMATIKGSSEEWYLRDGTMKLWLVLAMAFLIYFAQSTGTDANAMPVRKRP